MKIKTLRNKEINLKLIIVLGIIVVSLIGMIVYQSYALFKLNESHNIVDGEVGTFTTGDVIIYAYVDGQKVNTFPALNSDKVYERIECTNSGVGSFDSVDWELTVSDISEPTSCNVYFITDLGPFPGEEDTVISGNIRVDYDTNMIPVAYNASGGTVKADVTNANATYKWFDYTNYIWANAVLVTDSKRETYKNAAVGTAISESDILAYLVYIPRYRYQLFNANNSSVAVQTINVEFENKTMAKSMGSTNGAWLTHPAFTFGTTELNGIWVGKFETSPEESSTCYTASNETNCNSTTAITNITPRIKPNKNSWRNININNMFTISQYFKSKEMYGISTSDIDSHMIKNMEWGAIAYLSLSQYGVKGKIGGEIYINNYRLDSSYNNTLTGCSSGSAGASVATTCMYPYPNTTVNGTGASSSGTIYGIYDLSGASYEFVMGNMASSNANYLSHTMNVGWVGTQFGNYTNVTLPKKYYDIYDYAATVNNAASFARGKLGDATRETLTCTNSAICGWNSDYSLYPYSSAVWFLRGGDAGNGMYSGLSFVYFSTGGTDYPPSSRVILVVE